MKNTKRMRNIIESIVENVYAHVSFMKILWMAFVPLILYLSLAIQISAPISEYRLLQQVFRPIWFFPHAVELNLLVFLSKIISPKIFTNCDVCIRNGDVQQFKFF